jgi:hypothetical protein
VDIADRQQRHDTYLIHSPEKTILIDPGHTAYFGHVRDDPHRIGLALPAVKKDGVGGLGGFQPGKPVGGQHPLGAVDPVARYPVVGGPGNPQTIQVQGNRPGGDIGYGINGLAAAGASDNKQTGTGVQNFESGLRVKGRLPSPCPDHLQIRKKNA